MWILCLAEDSHEISYYFLCKTMKKKSRLPSAAVMIGAFKKDFSAGGGGGGGRGSGFQHIVKLYVQVKE